jgi:hypothetical protein
LKVLIACEFSGIVRRAFANLGYDTMSCDLLPTELPCFGNEQHYQGDIRDLFNNKYGWKWDLMIAHPPYTHLAVSGARWFKYKKQEQDDALEFVRMLMYVPVPKICIENPVSIISTQIRRPEQIIQPWMFGHGETKTTCLWLKGLPKLVPTNIVSGREDRIHQMPPSENRWKERSRTYQGIAQAMAEQWGCLL